MSAVEMQDSQRPGFWRHAGAMLIDIIVIGFVLGLAGLALFAPTDGRIRVRSLPIDFTSCSSQAPDAEKVALPSDFHPTNASRCTKSIFGYVYDRTLKLSEVTRSGMTTYSRDITFPVDADGHPTKAFYLDELSVPLLAIYLLLLEWRFGRTLGKAATGVLIRSLDRRPLTFGQAFKRVLIRIIPFFPSLSCCCRGCSAPRHFNLVLSFWPLPPASGLVSRSWSTSSGRAGGASALGTTNSPGPRRCRAAKHLFLLTVALDPP